MKKLVLAAVAASVMMPAMASAWSNDVAVQPLEVCASKHSSQEDRDECVIQHIRDLHVIIDFEERQKNEALEQLEHTSQSTEDMLGILEVVTNHKAQAGANFAKDPVGYMEFAFGYLEDRQADLRRAEKRILVLENAISKYAGWMWALIN